jgi:hypothetical protein
LLNAALIDSAFGADLLAHPAQAALSLSLVPDEVLGCPLPDPVLQLPSIDLSTDDWEILQEARPAQSLAGLWQDIKAASDERRQRRHAARRSGETHLLDPISVEPTIMLPDRTPAA